MGPAVANGHRASLQLSLDGSLHAVASEGEGHASSGMRDDRRETISLFLQRTISKILSPGEDGVEEFQEAHLSEPSLNGANGHYGNGHTVSSQQEFRRGVQSEAVPSCFPYWKRLLDLSLVAVTMWVWLPLMLLIMCLIKLVSPGPALYRQKRIGYRGRTFMIFKFRSMKVNAETRMHEDYVEKLMQSESPLTKLDANDPRLIPLGRFLRATGLDELPQLFNVAWGDMSLVGPRPCTVEEFERYLPWQKRRVNAPPGLTGYWQVNGKNKTTFTQMMKMDLFYARKMSLWLDLVIMAKTFPAIFQQTWESLAGRLATQNIGKSTSLINENPLNGSANQI